MAAVGQERQVFRFGVFELDPRSRELRKHGVKLKVQVQPLQILTILLEHAGEVVTREEIQKRLWPDNTYVDFGNAINSAVRKLRDALGDGPENPRFIETLARRGYRFIAPVSQTLTAPHAKPVRVEGQTISFSTEHPRKTVARQHFRWVILATAGALLIAALGVSFWIADGKSSRTEARHPLRYS